MKKRLEQKAQRVRECNLAVVLRDYGYPIFDSPRQQQFSCDLHGEDHKPSARFYPDTNSTYCWVCQKPRNPIDWVMEKEGVSFSKAINILEHKFRLEPLPWVEEENSVAFDESPFQVRTDESFESVEERTKRFLQSLTEERDLGLKAMLNGWEVFDRVRFYVLSNTLTKPRGMETLRNLKSTLLERLKFSDN